MSFFKELKRRNVFRVGIAYTVATWLLIQVSDTVFPRIGLPDSAVTLVIALFLIRLTEKGSEKGSGSFSAQTEYEPNPFSSHQVKVKP